MGPISAREVSHSTLSLTKFNSTIFFNQLLEKVMECKLINLLEDAMLGGVAFQKAKSQGCFFKSLKTY